MPETERIRGGSPVLELAADPDPASVEVLDLHTRTPVTRFEVDGRLLRKRGVWPDRRFEVTYLPADAGSGVGHLVLYGTDADAVRAWLDATPVREIVARVAEMTDVRGVDDVARARCAEALTVLEAQRATPRSSLLRALEKFQIAEPPDPGVEASVPAGHEPTDSKEE